MKEAILRLHDYLSRHRPLVWLLMALLFGLCVYSASRMDFQEDISAFLPHDAQAEKYAAVYEQLGGHDKIAVFFEAADGETDADGIIAAMDIFADHWAEDDTLQLVPDLQPAYDGGQVREVMDFIAAGIPYFLTDRDYERMDSLLAQPGYVAARLDEVKASLYAPGSAYAAAWLRSDPLSLFTPVLGRLSDLNPARDSRLEDGYLFTPDGRCGVIFFNSPFGGSESGRNAELSALLQEVSHKTQLDAPDIRVFATGGPLVAVENASRIKKDSLLAVAIAVLLIGLVLWLSFRRFSDVLWIGVTILFGAAFALGVISLFKSSISIIVLGIGSMIIGIAVNYPLHFVDHLKYRKDRRQTLADQINPLLVGNVTTVGAFASLLLLKADALHDFGAMGALMLVGTICFVLCFLPVLVPEAKKERRTIRLDWDRHLNPSRTTRRIILAAFVLLTLVFLPLSRRISFDSDMQHINYMTADQRRGFALLTQMGDSDPDFETVYAVAPASTPEEAAALGQRLADVLDGTGRDAEVHSIVPFFPSGEVQEQRLSRWSRFKAEHPFLETELRTEARTRGFSESAFAPFCALLERTWDVQPAAWFEPLTRTLGAAMLLPSEAGTQLVSHVRVPRAETEDFKQALAGQLPEGCFCFSSADVGNRLVGALSDDFDMIGLLCSLIVFLFLWASFRSLELSVTSFLPLALGWVWILGMMQIFGLRFNIVNIILATFIFGQGDDYTIFITEGLMYEHACGKKILSSYKNCVMLSALIMFIGIGALVVARHPAMKSLAYVTVIGMFTVVAMAWYLPPLVFRWLTRHRDGSLRKVPLTLRNLAATAWIGLVFLFGMVVCSLRATLFFGRDNEANRLRYHRFIQRLSRLAVKAIPGARFTLSNPHEEDFSKPAIYVCNHQSHFDVLPLLALQPKLVFMTNDWAWKFYGPVIRRAEFYPASMGMEGGNAHLKSLLERGYSLAVFPEGTRSMDCSIQRFHRGAFLTAREMGLDILPLYIHGFGYSLPKHDFVLRRAGLYLEVGERVPAGMIPEDVKDFVRNYRHAYAAVYDRIRRDRETAAYNAPFVRYQYLYKGEDAMRECASVLKRSTFEEIDQLPDTVRTVVVRGSGCGVYALLLALTHRDKEIYACETDEVKHLTAARCTAVPANLHHVLLPEPGASVPVSADLTVTR